MSEPTEYRHFTHRNPGSHPSDERPDRIPTLRSSQPGVEFAASAKRSVNRAGSRGRSRNTVGMRLRPIRSRLAAVVGGSVLVLAACGGGESSGESAGSTLPAPPDVVEVDPAADTAANQLPDVVVDDIVAGNKVNVRNLAPSDTPILLWMLAPH
jgi:hypothetical protein